jgi:hypothetical protein
MANILRKIGDEFARSDTNGYKALMLWLFILASAGTFFYIGTVYSSPSFIVACLAIGSLLTIPYIYHFIRWIGNVVLNFLSRWVNNYDNDKEDGK